MGNQYELVLVYDSDLDETGVRTQLDKVSGILKAHQGSVLREEVLGRQQLSYPMKKKTYGSYVILVVEAEPTFVADFTRQLRITDEVLRFSAVKKDKFAPDFVRRAEERSSSRKPRSDGPKSDSPKSGSPKSDSPKSDSPKDASAEAGSPKGEKKQAAEKDSSPAETVAEPAADKPVVEAASS